MHVTRRTVLVASGTSAVLAGCIGDDGAGPGDATADEDASDDGSTDGSESSNAAVQLRSHDEYGDVLVGPDGLTLYNFDSDERGAGESTCYDGCAENWPPLTVTDEPVAGDGVSADLTTLEREDGDTQVVANGWPLYYFAPDEQPGDTGGQGANDVWWVLDPDGNPIRNSVGGDAGGSGDEDDGGGSDDGGDGGGPGY